MTKTICTEKYILIRSLMCPPLFAFLLPLFLWSLSTYHTAHRLNHDICYDQVIKVWDLLKGCPLKGRENSNIAKRTKDPRLECLRQKNLFKQAVNGHVSINCDQTFPICCQTVKSCPAVAKLLPKLSSTLTSTTFSGQNLINQVSQAPVRYSVARTRVRWKSKCHNLSQSLQLNRDSPLYITKSYVNMNCICILLVLVHVSLSFWSNVTTTTLLKK